MAHRDFMCFVIVFYSSNGFLNGVVAVRGDPGEFALDFRGHQDTMFIEERIFEAGAQNITAGDDLAFLDILIRFEQPLFVEVKSWNVGSR